MVLSTIFKGVENSYYIKRTLVSLIFFLIYVFQLENSLYCITVDIWLLLLFLVHIITFNFYHYSHVFIYYYLKKKTKPLGYEWKLFIYYMYRTLISKTPSLIKL